MSFTEILASLRVVSASPLALIAYMVVVAAWALRAWLLYRPQRQAERILLQYESDGDRLSALKVLLGSEPPTGLSSRQLMAWARLQGKHNDRVLLLIAYIASLGTVVLVFALTAARISERADKPPILIDTDVERAK